MDYNNMEAFNISQVYPDRYTRPLKKQDYHVGLISKKETSRAIKALQRYPTPQHLKRVKPLKQQQHNQIILCLQTDTSTLQKIKEQLKQLLISTRICPLPNDQCYFKENLPQWEQLWPTSFKNQVEIIKHSESEIEFIKGLKEEKGRNIHLFSKGLELLMSWEGECKENSVLHGVVLGLEKWPETKEFKEEPEVPKGTPENERAELLASDKYYYLTGLRMFIRGNICQMCTMALVHSRLQRLYITTPNLQPIKDICYQQNLNHNYHLFHISD